MMPMLSDRVYDRAVYVRKMSGKSQEETAAAAGLEVDALRQYEAGIGDISEPEFARLAAALGVDARVILHRGPFAAWVGDRPIPEPPPATVLGMPAVSPMRFDRVMVHAFSDDQLEETLGDVNDFLAMIDGTDSVLSVSPVSVTVLQANEDTPYEPRLLYTVTVVTSSPEACRD